MKKRLIEIVLVCLSILFCSCSKEPISNYEFSNTKITLVEPNNSLSFSSDMASSFVGNNKYSFEQTIRHKDMVNCISKTEAIYEYIGITKGLKVNIFSKKTYNKTYIKDNEIYTYVQNWDSLEYISRVLLTIFGENCNYGAIYGYSQYISFSLNNKELKEENISYNEKFDLSSLDLNILCFNDKFTTKEEIKILKKISFQFVLNYINSNDVKSFQNLLTTSGNIDSSENFSDTLSNFYSKHNLNYRPSNILYGYGGVSYDYIVKCEFGNFYLEREWRDENQTINPLISPQFLHKNYKESKKFFETNVIQMSQYQTLFGFETYNNNLNIVFTNNKSNSLYSYYQPGNHTIYLMNVDSLMHEYIHSITSDKYSNKSTWNVEGLARYFSYKYDYYGIAMLNDDYNNADNKFIQAYKNKINRDIDMEKDFNEIENIAVYCYSYFDPDKNYLAGSSFVGYLVSKFGEKELIDMIFSKEGIKNSQYIELVNEWSNYINSNYSNYVDYKI